MYCGMYLFLLVKNQIVKSVFLFSAVTILLKEAYLPPKQSAVTSNISYPVLLLF